VFKIKIEDKLPTKKTQNMANMAIKCLVGPINFSQKFDLKYYYKDFRELASLASAALGILVAIKIFSILKWVLNKHGVSPHSQLNHNHACSKRRRASFESRYCLEIFETTPISPRP
jgi:hypothetical protein